MQQFISDHIRFFVVLDNIIIGLTCFAVGIIYVTLVYAYYFNYAQYDKNVFDTISYTKEDPKKLTLPIPTGRFNDTLYTFMSVLFYHLFSRRMKIHNPNIKHNRGRRLLIVTIITSAVLLCYGATRILDIIEIPSTEKVTRTELKKMGIDEACIDELIKRDIILLENKN